MLKQVEDVLRISQLERGTLQIEKKEININDVIRNAVSHVSLIIKSRNGEIDINLNSDLNIITISFWILIFYIPFKTLI